MKKKRGIIVANIFYYVYNYWFTPRRKIQFVLHSGQGKEKIILKRKVRVVFVELQLALPNLASFLICPCYGIVLLATKLRNLGYTTSVMVEGVTKFSIEDLEEFDVICFSVKSGSANKTYQWVDQLRNKGKIIFGGTHATYFPEDCLDHCDYVVRGEGDDVLPALLDCLENKEDLTQIQGISYSNNGDIVHNENISPPADLSIPADYSLVRDISHWSLVKSLLRGRRVTLPVQSSRGCPKNCSFCVVNKMFGSGYRKRPIDAVISELKSALRYTRSIQFIDNDFVGSSDSDVERTAALLEAIIDSNLKFSASAFVKLDIAKNRKLLELMRKAGIKTLMIGFESINSKTLDKYNKHQEANEMIQTVNVIKEYGLDVSATFMAGSDEDNYQSIIQTAKVATKWDVEQLYYFMLSPYPEMSETIPPKYVFLNNWDYATGNSIYFFPKNISPCKLQKAVNEANKIFNSYKRILNSLARGDFKKASMLLTCKIMFSKIFNSLQKEYIPFLENLEKEYYVNNKLNENALKMKKITKLSDWN
ncbi:MAG: B12-binding domain-containing radical SAM protein [Planctomycetes bacterium]|nr:B12-binding domain-containing radical SAM protein [Planctomycetota bacterium]